METKTYRLLDAKTVMPVVVRYKQDEDGILGELQTAVVYVNYGQDEVYFTNNPELDCDEMKRAVLATLDPASFIDQPEVPQNVWDVIEQVRAGNYGQDIADLNRRQEDNGDE